MSVLVNHQQAIVRLCELEDVPLGQGRAFRVGADDIAVFRTRAGRIFAVDNVCPHRGGPLADGILTGDRVVCPYHAFRFELATGDCDQQGNCNIRTFPVEVRQGEIFLNLTVHGRMT